MWNLFYLMSFKSIIYNKNRYVTFEPANLLLYKLFLVRGGEGGENISSFKIPLLYDVIEYSLFCHESDQHHFMFQGNRIPES